MSFPQAETQAVALHVVDLGEQKELDEEIQYMKTAEIEAHYVAAQIKNVLGTPFYNPKSKQEKPLSYADVVVLLRSTKQWANTFNEVFTQWGIPVFVDVGTSFFEALEVTILLSLLKVIDNRNRDLEWMTVLRSPIVGLNVDALATIRSNSQDGTFYESIQQYVANQNDDLAKTLRGFIDKLEAWTVTATFRRLDDWLWSILDETQFYAYCGAMPEGPSRQANLRLLMERAGALEGQPESGLYHFIQVIERMEKSGGDLEAAKLMPEQEDAVRIMSIHKSKGLEFPLVIVSGLGKRFNLSDTYEDVMVHKHLGLGPKFVDWEGRNYRYTFPQLAMRKQMTNEMLSEEMRILYVALTRPVNALWLVGSTTNWESAYKKWRMGVRPFNLAQARSYLDWLGMYAFDEEENTIDIDFKQAQLKRKVPKLDGAWAEVALFRMPVSDIMAERTVQEISRDQLQTQLEGCFSEESTYDHTDLSEKLKRRYKEKGGQLPSKISVSKLKALKDLKDHPDVNTLYLNQTLARPKWDTIEELVDASERGTAFHKMLQYLHYEVETPYSLDHIERFKLELTERALIQESLVSAVPSDWLLGYTQTDMYKRIASAKRIEKEYPFIIRKQIGEDFTLVQGIIDLYFEEATVEGSETLGVLVDFKTDRVKSKAEIAAATAYHKEQLMLYAEAIELVEGYAPKEIWLYFATVQTWVQVK
jgi:ATP-dependent helicase/nuclease subunit A